MTAARQHQSLLSVPDTSKLQGSDGDVTRCRLQSTVLYSVHVMQAAPSERCLQVWRTSSMLAITRACMRLRPDAGKHFFSLCCVVQADAAGQLRIDGKASTGVGNQQHCTNIDDGGVRYAA